ncbi:MAG: DUF4249 family protein [Saprospiraceae bacterium]|nr:DUF4249 family protein [Saprospiraceae bacterium]
MKSLQYFYLFIIGMCSVSCENFFETTLELDPPPFEKKLVVFAELNTSENIFQVRVGENFGILDNKKIPTLLQPTASFSINGIDFPVITASQVSDFFLFTFNLENAIFTSGQMCTLRVTHPGFRDAISTQIIPERVEIKNLKFVANGGLDTDGSERSKVDVVFSDPAGKNFYQAYIQLNNPNFNYPTYTSINEPGAAQSIDGYSVIFNDLTFEGKTKDLSLLIYRTSESDARDNEISLFWRNVTEDFFKYSKTVRVHYDSQDNPFATPSDVYTNVSGGLGIFHIYHETEYFIF